MDGLKSPMQGRTEMEYSGIEVSSRNRNRGINFGAYGISSLAGVDVHFVFFDAAATGN
jgi:hypothetical protein